QPWPWIININDIRHHPGRPDPSRDLHRADRGCCRDSDGARTVISLEENNMTVEITRAIAEKVLAVVDAGLTNGLGVAEPGKMCVEAAVCYALGLPHGDDPACVSRALRSLKIRLNDSAWSSDKARAK